MNNKQYYVYILFNKRNGTLYVGVTNDLVKEYDNNYGALQDEKGKFNLQIDDYCKEYIIEHLHSAL